MLATVALLVTSGWSSRSFAFFRELNVSAGLIFGRFVGARLTVHVPEALGFFARCLLRKGWARSLRPRNDAFLRMLVPLAATFRPHWLALLIALFAALEVAAFVDRLFRHAGSGHVVPVACKSVVLRALWALPLFTCERIAGDERAHFLSLVPSARFHSGVVEVRLLAALLVPMELCADNFGRNGCHSRVRSWERDWFPSVNRHRRRVSCRFDGWLNDRLDCWLLCRFNGSLLRWFRSGLGLGGVGCRFALRG